MPKRITELELRRAQADGAQVTRVPALIESPQLQQLLENHQSMKREKMEKWDQNHQEKLAKYDKLIAAIDSIQTDIDLKPVMDMLKQIQKEHSAVVKEHATIKAEHKMLMEMEMKEHSEDHERCEYRLTFERNERGLIDGTKGILFTPVS